MVMHDIKTSLSEEHVEAEVLNNNGKRLSQDQNKDGPKRLKTKSWFRQPTAHELNRLQETENLFNSNLFRLQIDEVLEEVKLKEKIERKFSEWFTVLKKHLLQIDEDETEYDLTEPTLFKQLKVKLPVSKELKKTRCTFKFHKFKDINIVGAYELGCAINSKLKVDVQITVPAQTYTKNDSINYRYHKKRAAYLAYIASHLNKLESIEELQYSWLNGCSTKPVLDLKPAGKLGNHLSVRINLVCEAEAYKFHRFSSSRNNLRESWLLSSEEESNTGNTDIGPPTPYYNSSILSDLTASANQEFLSEILSKSDNLKQAVVLLKIWLRQRNLQVSGHVVSLLVAYFVQNKRINNIMSSYQIVRNIWIALKTLELDTKGISLLKSEPVPIEEFHKHFPVVFIDRTGYHNITWDMCRGTYDALRRESELAVEMLDNGKINSFIALFMTPVKPLYQFDHILRFKDFKTIKETILDKAPNSTKVNYGVDQLALVTDTLHALLAKGLGNRVHLILQLVEADFSWSVKKTPEKVKGDGYNEKLSFGMILNADNATNTVEKGPPANLPEAEQFRAFWGEKSELRRFQDGSITETCLWRGDSASEKRTLTKQIVDYLLQLKYEIGPSSLFHICCQLDGLTARKQYSRAGRLLHAEECSLEVLQAFDDLRRDLRQLTQLPLDISAVYGTSAVFSYSSPLPPLPRGAGPAPWRRGRTAALKAMGKEHHVIPDYTPVAHAVIELGHSGKWPGELEAFRCLKAAFHLQIAERLHQQYSLAAQAYPAHIDVLKKGIVFRLSIAHPKEITLLRKVVEEGVAKYKESEESVRLQCETVLMPRLRGALHGLQQKHRAFGPTVCLLKRWLSCQLLSPPHTPPLLAELLAATTLARQPAPPAGPTRGLLAALRCLADTDWDTEIVVLDFNEDMTPEEIATIQQQLSADESRPPICIATAYDGPLPGVWSQGLTAAVKARAQALARSTLTYMEQQLDNMNDNLLGAFVPSLSEYDVLVHLNPHLVPHGAERPRQPPALRPLPEHAAEDIVPIVEFHPVREYLAELRSAFSDFALFFHDQYGGDVIAVLWKPEVAGYKDFQLLGANALKPVQVNGDTKYKVNTEALIQDFRILGDGLVKDITVKSLEY